MFKNIYNEEFKAFKNEPLEEIIRKCSVSNFSIIKDAFNGEVKNFGEFLSLYESLGFTTESLLLALFHHGDGLCDFEISLEHANKFTNLIKKNLSCNYTFKLHLLFVIVLRNLNLNDYYERELSLLAANIKFDETMLITLLAIDRGYLLLESIIRKKMIEVMNTEKFNLDMDKLLSQLKDSYSFGRKSEYSMVKSINKILKLKLKDFKDNENILNAIKEYRQIGTANCNYDLVCNTMNLTGYQYYALSLKVCNESYVEGAPRAYANKVIYRNLSNSIDIFTEDIDKYLIIEGEDGNKVTIIKPIDINVSEELKERMYNNLEKIYIKENMALNIAIIDSLLMDSRFFNIFEMYIKGKKYKYYLVDYIVEILQQDLSEEFKCKYFNLINNYNLSIGKNNLYQLIIHGIVSLRDIFSKDSQYIKPMSGILDELFRQGFDNMFNDREFILFAELFYEDSITLKRFNQSRANAYYHPIAKIQFRLKSVYLKSDFDLDLKRDSLIILEKYKFAFVNPSKGNSYSLFILDNIDDEFFKSTLGLTDDNIREIANYVLVNDKNLDSSYMEKVNRLILTKDDYQLIEDKRKLESIISNYRLYEKINNIREIANVVNNSNSKKVLIEYLLNLVALWQLTYRNIGLYYVLIVGLNKYGVITDKEREEILKKRNSVIENIFE